jgi:hypothetical protein
MAITLDKYELPEAVADSVRELAKLMNVYESSIRVLMSRAKQRGGRCKYIKVELEEAQNDRE